MPRHQPPRPSGVNRVWVMDYTEDYDIDRKTVTRFLERVFGNYDFFVKVC